MLVRDGTESDIPSIVELLKVSLGEALMPKSEAYWRWKHVDNPFGKSPVLVAELDGELIGVRAFMRWNWSDGTRVYNSIRAVDTATHPKHQGKGIFRKLTMALVDRTSAEGSHFIFNTPNKQSAPGYLKMGWQRAGKLPVGFSVCSPFSMKKAMPVNDSPSTGFLRPGISDLLQRYRAMQSPDLHTLHTEDSLLWRYATIPVAEYFTCETAHASTLNGLAVCRLKPSRAGLELRVCDFFVESNDCMALLYQEIVSAAKRYRARFITFSGANGRLLKPTFAVTLPVGPMVTVRPMTNSPMEALIGFSKWRPSLGDFEIF